MISSGSPKVSLLGVTNTARPEGSSTRTTSRSTASGSGTCSIDCTESTEAKDPSPNGSRRMSARTVSRSLARRALPGRVSTPTVSRGRELPVGMAGAAPEVEHAPVRQQRCAQPVRGDMALIGGVKATGVGGDPLSGDHERRASTYTVPPARAATSRAASAAADRGRQCDDAAGQDRGPRGRRRSSARCAPRGRRIASYRLGVSPGSRRDEPVQPAELDLAPTPVADALDPQAPRSRNPAISAPAGRCTRWRGRSSAKPARRRTGAPASSPKVRDRGREQSPGRGAGPPRGRWRRPGRRGARASARRRSRPTRPGRSSKSVISTASTPAPLAVRSRPTRLAPLGARRRVDQRRVAAADVEQRARAGASRCSSVRARRAREIASRASPPPPNRPESGRYQARYAALQLGVVGRREGGRRPALRADGQPRVSRPRRGAAPGAERGRRARRFR